MNFSNTSPSHGLQLFTNCPSVGPSQGLQSFRNRLLQRGSPMGSQALPANLLRCGLLSLHGSTVPGRSLLQRRLPTGSQLPSGTHLLWCGVPSTGCRWTSAPLWTSMGCRGTTCLTMVFITSCKGRLSVPASGAPPPPPSSLTSVPAELFLSHHLTPISRLPFFRSFFAPA